MTRKIQTILSGIVVSLFCSGCNQDTGINRKNLEPYEALIGATDAEVVETLGEGTPVDAPDSENQPDTAIMWQREYQGCLFAEGTKEDQGKTVVQYFMPDWDVIMADEVQNDPREVSCVIMTATLPQEDSVALYESVASLLGEPYSEESSFKETEQYSGYWQKGELDYLFWYDPPQNDGEVCGVMLVIQSREYSRTSTAE